MKRDKLVAKKVATDDLFIVFLNCYDHKKYKLAMIKIYGCKGEALGNDVTLFCHCEKHFFYSKLHQKMF